VPETSKWALIYLYVPVCPYAFNEALYIIFYKIRRGTLLLRAYLKLELYDLLADQGETWINKNENSSKHVIEKLLCAQ
jgi:hypothetical protein